MLVNILSMATTLVMSSIFVLGCAVIMWLLSLPIYHIANFTYGRMKSTMYFLSFVKHKKEFISWYKENKNKTEISEDKNFDLDEKE